MRFGIASSFACGAGLWRRLQDEGNDVRVWRGDTKDGSPQLLTSHRYVGEGIVPLLDSWHELLAWCKEEQSILLFDSSGLGALADDARKAGVRVIGGGSFCDKLEKNRSFGREIVRQIGVKSPACVEFSSIDECLELAKSGGIDRPVYWKTDSYISGDATKKCDDSVELAEYLEWAKTQARSSISCVLEEKLDGCALSTARYWNGRAWVGPYEWTFERKKFMAGDVGPSTGCALNAVGFYEDDSPKIATSLHWEKLTELFLSYEAPPGLYDMNAIVMNGRAYFLEWTPRFGWDSEGTSNLLFDDYSAWLWYLATGAGSPPEPTRTEFALAVRLSVAPAPWEHGERDEKGTCVGIPISGPLGDLWSEGFFAYQLQCVEGRYSVAAPEGLVGLSAAVGDTTSALAEECIDLAAKLRPDSLQYRVDAGDAIMADAEQCRAEGFGEDLPSGLGE